MPQGMCPYIPISSYINVSYQSYQSDQSYHIPHSGWVFFCAFLRCNSLSSTPQSWPPWQPSNTSKSAPQCKASALWSSFQNLPCRFSWGFGSNWEQASYRRFIEEMRNLNSEAFLSRNLAFWEGSFDSTWLRENILDTLPKIISKRKNYINTEKCETYTFWEPRKAMENPEILSLCTKIICKSVLGLSITLLSKRDKTPEAKPRSQVSLNVFVQCNLGSCC